VWSFLKRSPLLKDGLSVDDKIKGINILAEEMKSLEDEEILIKTYLFKKKVSRGEPLDSFLLEAYATAKEAFRRSLGIELYDSQLRGALLLHEGKVVEMLAGEGKTFAAVLPAYLNSLTGDGVHVLTSNEYLAERDAAWMEPVYDLLGIEVGVVKPGSNYEQRYEAYRKDVTYGVGSEFVFDYLRTNAAYKKEDEIQRGLNFALIDECDSILIDEARNPLVLSRLKNAPDPTYKIFAKVAEPLKPEIHYELHPEESRVSLTSEGNDEIERILGIEDLYDFKNLHFLHKIQTALYVRDFLNMDKDYTVHEGSLFPIDPLTGRISFSRSFPDGTKQALEAKEGLEISREQEIRGLITYQNFFPLYRKIAGMTGSASVEEQELLDTYKLHVVPIPPNRPVIRVDHKDEIFKTEKDKNEAILLDVLARNKAGQPVLIGTPSILQSEKLSETLSKHGVLHEVLNARNHAEEAQIIARAGRKGAVTVITQMAGRGTDIVLDEGVPLLGGLHVIGTTRHESRRIDAQLRGRSGRQGDPGSSKFYLSLEDELLQRFGGQEVLNILNKMNIPDGIPISHPVVSRLVEQIQTRCEASFHEIRSQVGKYDKVLEKQREVFFAEREGLLTASAAQIKSKVFRIYEEAAERIVKGACNQIYPEDWDLVSLVDSINVNFLEEDHFTVVEFKNLVDTNEASAHAVMEAVLKKAQGAYKRKEAHFKVDFYAEAIRKVALLTIDKIWVDHLLDLEYLRTGIGLRAIGGKSPFLEYTIDAYEMFNDMMAELKIAILHNTAKLVFQITEEG